MTPPNHIRFIISCLTLLALSSMGCGTYLLMTGYQSGELFVGIATGITGGIVGMISMRGGSGTPTTQSGAIATEITNQPGNPVPTQPQP